MNIKDRIAFKLLAPLLAAGALLVPASSRAADLDADGISDDADGVPCDPRASSVAFAPAKDQQGSLVFEDLWPAKGDLDFNDVALSYNYIFFLDDAGRVSSIQASINLLAAGGTIANSVRLHLPVAADAAATIQLNGSDGVSHAIAPEANEHELVLSLIQDIHAAMGDTKSNSMTDKRSVPAVPLNLYIKFENPISIDLAQAPFDLYIERVDEPGHQIHQVAYAGTDTMDASLFGSADDGSTQNRHFVDVNGLPFALSVPATFKWPLEQTSISTAYPDITPWASSGGAVHADWYESHVDAASVWTGGADGSPPPVGVVLGPTDPSEDVQCAPWKGTVQFGEAPNLFPYGTATDPSGNVIVTGQIQVDSDRVAFVTKYDSHKKALWNKTLAGSTSFTPYKDAEAFGIVTDSESNIYVVGDVLGSIAGEEYNQVNAYNYIRDPYVAKLDPAGNVVWVSHIWFDSVRPTAWGITIAPNGTIDVVGDININTGFIAQLDSAGQVLSTKQIQLQNGSAMGIATDASGNMYVNGYSKQSNGNYGRLVAKYTPTGSLLWSHVDNNSIYSLSQLGQMAVDSQGNAFVSGLRQSGQACYSSCYSCGFNSVCCSNYCYATYDAPMWKIDSNGQQRWVTTVGNNSYAYATALDASGNPYYAGYTSASLQGQPLHGAYNDFVTKVNPNTGAIAWLRESGTDVMQAVSMATDPSGSVFVSGLTNTASDGSFLTYPQVYISKYDSNGTKQ